jgi:hypothetical protein
MRNALMHTSRGGNVSYIMYSTVYTLYCLYGDLAIGVRESDFRRGLPVVGFASLFLGSSPVMNREITKKSSGQPLTAPRESHS